MCTRGGCEISKQIRVLPNSSPRILKRTTNFPFRRPIHLAAYIFTISIRASPRPTRFTTNRTPESVFICNGKVELGLWPIAPWCSAWISARFKHHQCPPNGAISYSSAPFCLPHTRPEFSLSTSCCNQPSRQHHPNNAPTTKSKDSRASDV